MAHLAICTACRFAVVLHDFPKVWICGNRIGMQMSLASRSLRFAITWLQLPALEVLQFPFHRLAGCSCYRTVGQRTFALPPGRTGSERSLPKVPTTPPTAQSQSFQTFARRNADFLSLPLSLSTLSINLKTSTWLCARAINTNCNIRFNHHSSWTIGGKWGGGIVVSWPFKGIQLRGNCNAFI